MIEKEKSIGKVLMDTISSSNTGEENGKMDSLPLIACGWRSFSAFIYFLANALQLQ